MIGEIIAAIFIGIIAGFVGRALLPGDDSMGLVATIVVGIIGALVGWVLFAFLLGIGDNDKFDLGSIVGAIIGTMLVLLVLRMVRGKRGSTAPAGRWVCPTRRRGARRSAGPNAVTLPGALQALALGHLQRADDRRARLAGV